MVQGAARGLVVTWHPPEGGRAGGFLRAKLFVEGQRTFDLVIVDTNTTDIEAHRVQGALSLVSLRWAYARSGRAFKASRALNWSLFFLTSVLRGLTWKGRLDFVYVPSSELVHTALAGFLVARVRRIPLVFCNQNIEGVPLWRLNRILHKRADVIITVSAALRDELRRDGIGGRIEVGLVPVPDHSVPRQVPGYDAVFVGRHTAEKGVFDLLEIWRLCKAQRPSLRLALAGPCACDVRATLQRTIDSYSMSRNVALLGPISEEEKWNLYSRARLCVFPSRVEGWGIVPVEAHLAGLPVVAYDLPAYETTLRHSSAARLVPVGDVHGFCAAVLKVLAAPPDCGRARLWAKQFTARKMVLEEARLIHLAIAARCPPASVG